MEFEQQTVKESLNQAFLRDKIERDYFDTSANALEMLAGRSTRLKRRVKPKITGMPAVIQHWVKTPNKNLKEQGGQP